MATANPFFLKQTQFYKVGFPVEVQKCIGEYLMKHEQRTPTPTARIMNDALVLALPALEHLMEFFPIGSRYSAGGVPYTLTNIYLFRVGQSRLLWSGLFEGDNGIASHVCMLTMMNEIRRGRVRHVYDI